MLRSFGLLSSHPAHRAGDSTPSIASSRGSHVKRIILSLRPVIVSACAILFAQHATADPPAAIEALRVIKCVACEADRPAVVTGVAMTPDGRTVAAAMDDHRVLAWDATTGELKGRFEGHTDWVHSVVFSTDGVTLASGAGDRCLCLWDMANGEQRLTLSGCENAISAVSLHPNNQQLAVVGFNQKLRIINSSSGQTSQELVCRVATCAA
jgi:WD40 repeat protein